MRTILNIDDDLLSEAECVTGVSEKTALVRAGLNEKLLMLSLGNVFHFRAANTATPATTNSTMVNNVSTVFTSNHKMK